MASTYSRSPAQILEFSSFSTFPTSAANGQLAVALDTSFLYIYNSGSSSWIDIGGAGVPLGVGTIDGQTAVPNGLQIVSNLLYAQSASATRPGMVNTGVQTFAGAKTFSSALSMGTNKITNLGTPTDAADAATKAYVDSTEVGITQLTGDVTAGPGSGSQAATVAFVGGASAASVATTVSEVAGGINGQVLTSEGDGTPTWHFPFAQEAVAVATTDAIDFTYGTDPSPIDGYTLQDGDRVLVKDGGVDEGAAANGIYLAVSAIDPTTWVRAYDCLLGTDVSNTQVTTKYGDVTKGKTYVQISSPGVVGTNTLAYNTQPFIISTLTSPAVVGYKGGGTGSAGPLTLGGLTETGSSILTLSNFTANLVQGGEAPATIEIQQSDATHDGYLSSTDWSTFDGKQDTLTIGDLTAGGSDGIAVNDGSNAVLGTGTSIAQQKSDASHNGYLDSNDWTTFNNKQPAGNYAVTTAWASYTPTFTGFGTVSGVSMQWRRIGENVEIKGKFTTGTTTATEARMELPNSLTSGGATPIPSIQACGSYYKNTTSTTHGGVILMEQSVTYVTFGDPGTYGNSNINAVAKVNGDTFGGSLEIFIGPISVPIAGY